MSARRPIRTLQSEEQENAINANIHRPVAPRASIVQVFQIMFLQTVKKYVFCPILFRIIFYVAAIIFLSIIGDTLPIPQFYLSSKSNIFNQYFVKFGWFWTMVLLIGFIFLTSRTYCCGRTDMVIKHMIRLPIATFMWYATVNLFFVYLEHDFGTCDNKNDLNSKSHCITKGYRWSGFDVSGHSFLLIYSALILIEETRPIIGWGHIQHFIRDESFRRVHTVETFTPLRNLSNEDFIKLESFYKNPYYSYSIYVLFIFITMLIMLWDVMLLCTILYFHSLREKLFGGGIAIMMWFITYGVFYKILHLLPGEGMFKYSSQNQEVPAARPTNRKK